MRSASVAMSDLSSAQIRLEQVDDFDSGLEHLEFRRLILERRSRTVDRKLDIRRHRTHVVDWLSKHIEHAAQRLFPDRDGNGRAKINRFHPTD